MRLRVGAGLSRRYWWRQSWSGVSVLAKLSCGAGAFVSSERASCMREWRCFLIDGVSLSVAK